MKRGARVRSEDLGSLRLFREDFPRARAYLISNGIKYTEQGGVEVSVSDDLRVHRARGHRLRPGHPRRPPAAHLRALHAARAGAPQAHAGRRARPRPGRADGRRARGTRRAALGTRLRQRVHGGTAAGSAAGAAGERPSRQRSTRYAPARRMRQPHGAAMNGRRGPRHFPVHRVRSSAPGGAQQARGARPPEGRDHSENHVSTCALRGGADGARSRYPLAASARVPGAAKPFAHRVTPGHAVPITCHVGTTPAALRRRRPSSVPAWCRASARRARAGRPGDGHGRTVW